MRTIYHCCVDLGALIRGDKTATSFLRHYGGAEVYAMSSAEIIAEATIRRAKGMDAWPLCDQFTPAGQCKGHPQ